MIEKLENSIFGDIAHLLKTQPANLIVKISPNQGKKRERKNKRRRSIKSGYYGQMWLDSSWELAWVLYNESEGIPFERNSDKFPYYYNHKLHHYIPDFKLPNGTYVELKGKEPKICQYKYKALPENKLIILRQKEIRPIMEYVVKRFGKQFWKLLKDNPH